MVFENAKYIKGVNDRVVAISAVADGKNVSIPLIVVNRYYDAILEWAKIDGNTIAEAD